MVYLLSEGALLKYLSELRTTGFRDGILSDLCKSNFGTPAGGNFVSFILTAV